MTTLYRPVKITSAEQAEALPIGTVAFETGDQGQAVGASVRVRDGWHCTGYCFDFGGAEVLKHSDMIGDTALVPIEAEEEWTAMGEDHGDPWIAHIGHDGIDGTREEAEAYTRRFGGFLAHRNRTPWEEAQ